jgi:hypothetical protein
MHYPVPSSVKSLISHGYDRDVSHLRNEHKHSKSSLNTVCVTMCHSTSVSASFSGLVTVTSASRKHQRL